MNCPQDICPVCGWNGLNYDRDYPDSVYAVCPQCNWRAFDHYKEQE
jgi:predicted  nucleic acid-binding Zn-ribbon protein